MGFTSFYQRLNGRLSTIAASINTFNKIPMLLLNTTSIGGLHIAHIEPADFRLWFWFHLNTKRHGSHCR